MGTRGQGKPVFLAEALEAVLLGTGTPRPELMGAQMGGCLGTSTCTLLRDG